MGPRLLLDTFHRTDSEAEWGTPDEGNPWIADLATDGSVGVIRGGYGAGDPRGETGILTDLGETAVVLTARLARAGIFQGFFFGASGPGDDDNIFLYHGAQSELPGHLLVILTADGTYTRLAAVPYEFEDNDRWTIVCDLEEGAFTVAVNDELRIQLFGLSLPTGTYLGYYDGDDSGLVSEIEVATLG